MKIEVKSKKEVLKKRHILAELPTKIKPIDVSKYLGKFKMKEDPLQLQKEWRDE